MQLQTKPKETLIKVLANGVITIPKAFRDQLDIQEGDVARAKVVGDQLIIQSGESIEDKNVRTFTKEQIDEWVKEDELPEPLASQTEKYWADKLK